MSSPPSSTRSFLDASKAQACVHCGLCLSACPTYLETGNENDSPRGRIYIMRALEEQRLALDELSTGPIDRCLGCRACEVACPSGVQYGALLEETREHIEQHHRRPLRERLWRWGIEFVFSRPVLLRMALIPARLIRAARLGWLLPRVMREALALLPPSQPATPIPVLSPAAGSPKRQVGFLRGCVMQVLFARTNAASVKLLNQSGCDVLTPPEQGCCGALFAHSGRLDAARDCARKNIATFEAQPVDAIVVNAAGCGSMLKEYGHLLKDDPAWRERAARFSEKVRDLVEELKPAKAVSARATTPLKVTYHDACHLAHAQRICTAPRDLVRAIQGVDLLELTEASMCCGSAGSYNLTEPQMAAQLQERKCAHIVATGADVVLTSNPGCLLQIQAGLERAGAGHIRVEHIADFLEREQYH